MLEHRVENTEQLAHTGHQRHLFGLASFQEPLIEGSDGRIVLGGYQGSHIEGGPYPGPAAPDSTPSPHQPTVPVQGSHSHQGANLLTGQVPSSGK